jgi:sulfatase modifying factor 1
MLGAAQYHAGELAVAERTWRDLAERHPEHPIRHRALYHLLDRDTWPMMQSKGDPDLDGSPLPGPFDRPSLAPHPEVRAASLRLVETDPRFTKNAIGMHFARLPAGVFTMGGSPALFPRELPVRRVTIGAPRLVSAYPVTRAQWNAFRLVERWRGVEAGTEEGDVPATRILYDDAQAFCAWLSERDGRQYRLPTEAEWEYASRGGLDGKQFPWGDEPIDPTRANYNLPRPVAWGHYAPNAYGVFDTVGNTAEWSGDIYLDHAYSLTGPEVTDPTGPTPEQLREAGGVHGAGGARGGYCGTEMQALMCRNSFRLGPSRGHGYSFRVVCVLDG